MLEYRVSARRIAVRGSEAITRSARLVLDTDVQGRTDAFNPTELLLAAVAACMIKGVERVAPMIHFAFDSIEVKHHATRQGSPPIITGIEYEIIVATSEDDRRLELLHTNIRQYGTISNTVSKATRLQGTIKRRD